MNQRNNHKLSKNIVIYSISFLLLTIALISLMTGYWWLVLEPRLMEEANTHAQVVAHSQTQGLEKIISNSNSDIIERNLNKELDHILLITEPTTQVKLFKSISIKLDYDVLQALAKNLNLSRGNENCSTCITVETALYSSTNDELMGIVKFVLNEKIFLKLKTDLEKKLFTETIMVFFVLFFAWFITVNLIVRLNKQEENRIKIEDVLRKNEKKYYRLVNSLNNYFTYRKDAQGKIIHVSDSVKQVIGYTVDDTMFNFVKYCRNSEARQAKIRGSEFDDEQICYEVEVKAKDGSIHNIELSELTIRDKDNQVVEYEGIAHDITEQKKHEKQLSDSKEQAELANKIKSQFLTNMSHEIRTPLNGIIGLGQVLLKTELTDRQRLKIEKINTSSDLLLNLVNEILDFSKVESGQMELDNVNFSIRNVVKNIYQLLLEKSTLKHLQLNTYIDPGIPDVMLGDPLRLSQILMNLTNNAIKFTEQGEINIRADLKKEDEHSYTVLFSIKDTGIGISSEDMNKLFKEFSQVDSSMSRKFGGTGLGLAICKKLTRLMHGDIWLESQPDIGSTFFFTVQLQRTSYGKHADAFNLTNGALTNVKSDSLDIKSATDTIQAQSKASVPRILLVEDNEINQDVALSLLEEIEVEVVTANNGREAVERVQEEPFSLILMDLQMPEMDGFQAVEHIRAIPAYANLPIIAMTAHAMAGDREKCLERGMDDYLAKPIDIDVFIDTVSKWLNTHNNETKTPEIKNRHLSKQTLESIRNIPGIDHEQVIKQFKGDYNRIKKFLTRFVDTKINVVQEITSCLDKGDQSGANQIVHNLKGVAGNISAIAIEKNSLSLEQAFENNDQAQVVELLQDIQSQLDALKVTIEQLA